MAETDAPQTNAAPETTPGAIASSGRVFLVVVDESPELKLAIRYACLRAKKTGGRVAMVHVTAPEDMQEWIGVSRLFKEESRQQAEALMQKMAAEVQKLSDAELTKVITQGKPPDMDGYADQLSKEEIQAMVAYVRELGKH